MKLAAMVAAGELLTTRLGSRNVDRCLDDGYLQKNIELRVHVTALQRLLTVAAEDRIRAYLAEAVIAYLLLVEYIFSHN